MVSFVLPRPRGFSRLPRIAAETSDAGADSWTAVRVVARTALDEPRLDRRVANIELVVANRFRSIDSLSPLGQRCGRTDRLPA